jgi:putative PIN family toxin of toxin-antitoxin system
LDPNVLVSALISPRGVPARVVKAAWEGRYELIVSDLLLSELEEVLWRDKFRKYVTYDEISQYLLFLRIASTLATEGEVKPSSPDPKDDYLVALARSSQAHFLVSGDPHLLGLEGINHGEGGLLTQVITPRLFLEELTHPPDAVE